MINCRVLPREPLHMINEVTKDTPPHLTNNFFLTKRGFKIASLNITSLTKHIDERRILLANHPLDVISINETRLDDWYTEL